MEPFFDNYKKVLPYFINNSPLPADGRERLQSPEQRARFDDTTKCIMCAACTTSCPSYWSSDDYLGPAALVAAHRFVFDSRDEAAAERMHIVSETSGLARCHTIFNCTMACPRDIQITKAIGELKMTSLTGKLDLGSKKGSKYTSRVLNDTACFLARAANFASSWALRYKPLNSQSESAILTLDKVRGKRITKYLI
jgi:Fe-S oxidoreductase